VGDSSAFPLHLPVSPPVPSPGGSSSSTPLPTSGSGSVVTAAEDDGHLEPELIGLVRQPIELAH
jgi:hypothetical protein